MKLTRILMPLLALIVLLSACSPAASTFSAAGKPVHGSGTSAEDVRDIGGVSAVRLETFGEVHISLGSAETLRMEGEENLLPYIDVRQEKGTLIISTKNNIQLIATKPIQFYIELKQLNAIDLPGSGSVDVNTPLQTGKFDTRLGGSGEISVPELRADSLRVDIPGSGSITISGEADQQEIDVSGSGSFYGAELASQKAVVDLSGSGSTEVNAGSSLNISLSGSGSVWYRGNPVIEKKITGSGMVEKLSN